MNHSRDSQAKPVPAQITHNSSYRGAQTMFDGRCCLQGMSHLKIERRDSANTASAFRTAINTSKAHKSKKGTGKATLESLHVWVGAAVSARKAGHNQTKSPLGSALSHTLGAEKIRAHLCHQIPTKAGHTGGCWGGVLLLPTSQQPAANPYEGD